MSHGIPLSYAIGLYCLVTQKLKQKRPSLMKRKPPTFLVEIFQFNHKVNSMNSPRATGIHTGDNTRARPQSSVAGSCVIFFALSLCSSVCRCWWLEVRADQTKSKMNSPHVWYAYNAYHVLYILKVFNVHVGGWVCLSNVYRMCGVSCIQTAIRAHTEI